MSDPIGYLVVEYMGSKDSGRRPFVRQRPDAQSATGNAGSGRDGGDGSGGGVA